MQKQARQLKIDANSSVFRDALRCYWMPRLLEKMAPNNTPSIQSTNPMDTKQPILGQPQHFNPPPQACLDPISYELTGSDNYRTEFAQSSPRTFTTTASSASVPFDSLVHGMHNGYNLYGLDLASASMSAIGYSSPSDCIGEGNNWLDGLWTSIL